jgi:hypothetical protein
MAINVKLPEALVETAKRYGNIEYRSVPTDGRAENAIH